MLLIRNGKPYKMKNPFKKYTGGSYASHIYSQIKTLEINDQTIIDVADKTVTEFRTTLAYVSKKYEISFRTRTDDDGDVWVNRIS